MNTTFNETRRICFTLYKLKVCSNIRCYDHKLKNHRAPEFDQKYWMKPPIEKHEYRTRHNNEFEKDFFKLMHNSVFGEDNGKCEK